MQQGLAIRYVARRLFVSIISLLLVGFSCGEAAFAQTADPSLIPPAVPAMTPEGINLSDQGYYLSTTDLIVGRKDDPSAMDFRMTMPMDAVQLSPTSGGHAVPAQWTDDLLGCVAAIATPSSPPTSVLITFDGQTHIFGYTVSGSVGILDNRLADGAIASVTSYINNSATYPNSYEFISRNGDVVEFTVPGGGGCHGLGPSAITRANGVRVNPVYDQYNRKSRVVNSFGYGMQFSYIPYTGALSLYVLTGVQGVFTNCVVMTSGCSNSVINGVSYANYSFTNQLNLVFLPVSMTDGAGRVRNYNYTLVQGAPPTSFSWTDPGASAPRFTVTWDGAYGTKKYITTLGTKTFTWQSVISNGIVHFSTTAQMADENGKQYSYAFSAVPTGLIFLSPPLLSTNTDPLGNVTSYQYDSFARLTIITFPQGNYDEYFYDSRGNVVEMDKHPKSGSSSPSIKKYAQFAVLCTQSTIKNCNKPTATIDENGNETDYTWSATHGGVLSKTDPSDSTGFRAATTYTYTTVTGIDGAVIYLLSQMVEAINPSSSVTTNYVYGSASSGFALQEIDRVSGSTTLRQCLKYDAVGNRTAETLPLGATSTCP
jgi:YD repeat-containing protein